jgi:NAD(P)H-dependent FMN reductase
MHIAIIIGSTRPGRLGDQIGSWIAQYTAQHTDFTVTIADLLELGLPLFDEPNHPMTGDYTKAHTKAWSNIVADADAFIVVTPEYNYTLPPALLNAIDFLHHEWKYKAVGFVGYGTTGAVRAIQTAKLLFANMAVMPIPTAVNLLGIYRPAVTTFEATEAHERAAERMLDELHIWAKALLPLHHKN